LTTVPSRCVVLANHSTEELPDVAELLELRGYRVERTGNVVATADRIKNDPPDLVVCQPLTSNLDGVEIQHLLSQRTSQGRPPILFLFRSPDALQQLLERSAATVDDFLLGPVSREELLLRIDLLLARLHRLQSLEQERSALEQETITDYKTGLYTDRYFFHRLREEVARARRHGSALSLVMFDFDNFKLINDRFDHVFGDFVLVSFAQRLHGAVRNIDIPARLGGDEFALLLPNTDLEEATHLAGRLREIAVASAYEKDGRSTHLSLSIGIDCLNGLEPREAEGFLRCADQALIEAKRRGKNCICLFPELARRISTVPTGESA